MILARFNENVNFHKIQTFILKLFYLILPMMMNSNDGLLELERFEWINNVTINYIFFNLAKKWHLIKFIKNLFNFDKIESIIKQF